MMRLNEDLFKPRYPPSVLEWPNLCLLSLFVSEVNYSPAPTLSQIVSETLHFISRDEKWGVVNVAQHVCLTTDVTENLKTSQNLTKYLKNPERITFTQ